jgi:shikimate kinase
VTRPVVVLVGPPGAGKSTVGRAVADRLGVGFRDTDGDVERLPARRPASLRRHGERASASSSGAVATALCEHDGVLSLGGGRCSPRGPAPCWRHVVVLLDVDLGAARAWVGRAPLIGLNRAASCASSATSAGRLPRGRRHVVDTSGRPAGRVERRRASVRA